MRYKDSYLTLAQHWLMPPRKLKVQLEQMKRGRALESDLLFANGVYWNRGSDGKLDEPFCPTCWDDSRKLIRPVYIETDTWLHLNTNT